MYIKINLLENILKLIYLRIKKYKYKLSPVRWSRLKCRVFSLIFLANTNVYNFVGN